MERLIVVKGNLEGQKISPKNLVITREAWNTITDNSPSDWQVSATPYLYASKELVVEDPYCLKWCKHPFDMKAPLLIGKPGTGKTHLLWAMRREVLHQARTNKFTNWTGVKLLGKEVKIIMESSTQILHRIRQGISDNTSDAVLDETQEAHILMIDDFGVEKISDWVCEQMFLIMDYRLVGGMPTAVSTNLSMGEIAANYGERIVSRLFEMCHKIEITGDDRRLIN